MLELRPILSLSAALLLTWACGAQEGADAGQRASAPATRGVGPTRSLAASPPQESLAPFKLTSAYSTTTSVWMGMWIAKDLGIYDKYGLEVEVVRVPGPQQVPAVLSGEAHIGGTSAEAVTTAYTGGAQVVIVAVNYQTLMGFLVGRPEVKSVADLRGKTVGITSFGSVSDFAIPRGLRHFGLDPEKDVETVTTRDQPNSRAALLSGAIDAYFAGPPDDLQARREGATQLFDFSVLRLPYSQATVFVTRRFLQENRDVVLRYLKAYVEAVSVLKRDRGMAMEVFKRWTGVADEEVLRYAVETAANNIPPAPKPNLEGMRNVVETVGRVHPATLKLNPSELVDTSLMEEIERSGLVDRLYPR